MAETKRWIIAEACEIAALLEPIALQHGYYLALRGEVLLTGRGKEINFLLVPVGRQLDPLPVVTAIANALQVSNWALCSDHHWLLFVKGKHVDVVALKSILP